jgi:hypothetical protein
MGCVFAAPDSRSPAAPTQGVTRSTGAGPSSTPRLDAHAPPSDAARLADLHELEAEHERLDDENSARAQSLRDQLIPAAARAVVRLEARGARSPAEAVYRCHRLTGWRCEGTEGLPGGDDTAHITEFPHASVPLRSGESFRLVDADHKQAPGLLKVGIAHPAKLHDSFDAVEPVPVRGEGWAAEQLPSGAGELLVIALFQDTRGFRKHVWVVRP